METRSHAHQIQLAAPPAEVFKLLITPGAIRDWWGATRAIVVPRAGGVWAAAWGNDEDIPEYVMVFKIKSIEPPHRLFLTETKYFAKAGPLPFRAEMTTEFIVDASGDGSILQVIQRGFPTDAIADAFYSACERGWSKTFDSIKHFLERTR